MDRDTMMTTLREAISKVLETMFFQPVQIVDNDCTLLEWFSQNQSLLGATLDFNGPLSGSLYLIIPMKVVSEITANFLGLREEEIDERQKRDTVKETLNMIGGNTLSHSDRKSVFRLGIPKLIEEHDLVYDKLADLKGDFVLIETEDNHLAVGVAID